jgi:hypothetical protein
MISPSDRPLELDLTIHCGLATFPIQSRLRLVLSQITLTLRLEALLCQSPDQHLSTLLLSTNSFESAIASSLEATLEK